MHVSGRGEALEYIYEDTRGQTRGLCWWWYVWYRLGVGMPGIPFGRRRKHEVIGEAIIISFFVAWEEAYKPRR